MFYTFVGNNGFFTETQFDAFGEDCLSPLFWYESNQDKSWAPHICCNSCSVILREWLKGKKISIACSTHGLARAYKTCRRLLFLLNSANKSRIIIEKIGTVKYLNLPSAIRLTPHSDSLTVPTTPHIHEL